METLLISALSSNAIHSIYDLIKDIYNFNMNEINDSIKLIGVNDTLEIIKSILSSVTSKNRTVLITINSINNTIKEINLEFEILKNLIEHHKQKYFYYYRSIDYIYHIEKIKNFNKLLLERIDILLRILKK